MKKIAIIGFGSEGLSAFNYFKDLGADITIFDESATPNQQVPEGAKFVTGKNCFADLTAFDVVVRFPAVAPSRIHTSGEVTSVIKEFFKACPAPIIGVTGSKGKGTTCSFIYEMLKNAGLRVHLAGNIGIPALNILPDVQPQDVVVLELSSFQLWDMDRSPHVAVVVMVEQEHLDIHADINDYLVAKTNIVRWQGPGDVTIYLPGNHKTEQVALQGEGKKIPYNMPPGAHVANDYFVMDGKPICPVSDLRLPGEHNVQNACAAITAAWQFTQDASAIAKALRDFGGLEHRLRFIREVRGVKYYDDSFATTPTSAVAALNAFPKAAKVIILGGSDKGADFTELGKTVATSAMRAVILMGLMRHRLHEALQKAGYDGQIVMFDESNVMATIINKAAELARPGDIVVMSPACASFDMFKNYKDRGEKFIAAVESL